ncbi:ArsR/SmtB family transcription factor [Pedobacter heparinus]|uniref:Regulatory protein ArsR n=1 Tax=Pedobacter heparinus (strain ATCC 13125 / DSM 2366 / CIP 104194 / JCM 7457 / NBRC 12017 / NCIMB 9290 / NRRL B-14731 / HIM 762-3) TaxID=485917 RepID=C6Y393_PEDHD|nr:metalloregulator ArsR/SmtB family transcription factor [Pedobacter heparinus]ACU05318.1 regulatory protein ArsR [Pedobacter heparinus DSM 2366]
MITRRDVFQAIADPIRRDIILKIAAEPLNLNAVAESFDISRQAISKHIQILTECGLIEITQKGRERYCQVKMDKLDEVSDWVVKSKKLWVNRFEKLDNYLKEIQTKDKNDGTI